jgi:hypothetical protein
MSLRTRRCPHAAFAIAALVLSVATAGAQDASPPAPTFEIAPRGYLQLDWRSYPDWAVATGTGRLNHDPFEVRRARVGVEGRWQGVSFELTIDPQDDDGVMVKDAYAQMRFTRAVRLRVGQFKIPGSREYGRSARTLDFLERAPVAQTLAAGRDIGGSVFGDLGERVTYEAGLFGGDGNGRAFRAGATAVARVEYALTGDLELGGSFSAGRTEAVDEDDPNGLVGRAASGYRFFEQVYVNGLRTRAGADGRWERGPWRVTGELLRVDEQRHEQGLDFENLPRAVATGWSLAVTRTLGRGQGRPRVRWREVELAARLDAVRLDDTGPDTGNASVRPRATDIRPRGVRAATLGASWAPSPWTRVMTNVTWEHYSEPRSSPEPGRSGFIIVGTRLQVSLR